MNDYGLDLIKDIYTEGLTEEVVDRNSEHMSEINIIIHKEGKFLQANEAILCFDESNNTINGSLFTTTAPFPNDDNLSLLQSQEFKNLTVFDANRRDISDGILDGLNQKRIVESVLPKVCIFYIYAGMVIIDSSTMDDVSINGGNYGAFKNTVNSDRQHSVFWNKYMTKQYPELAGKNYLSVPRGRIMYENKVFKIFIDKSYFDNTEVRKYLEKECQLSKSKNCGYRIEYIKSSHYDYTKYK